MKAAGGLSAFFSSPGGSLTSPPPPTQTSHTPLRWKLHEEAQGPDSKPGDVSENGEGRYSVWATFLLHYRLCAGGEREKERERASHMTVEGASWTG